MLDSFMVRGIIQECFKVQESFAEIQIDSTHLSISGNKICHVSDRPRVTYLFGRGKKDRVTQLIGSFFF